MSTEYATMDTTPVDDDTAATWEAAEARAWADLYAAAPAEWAAEVGLGTRWFGDTLAIHWAVTGRRYFSRAIGLGVTAPATARKKAPQRSCRSAPSTGAIHVANSRLPTRSPVRSMTPIPSAVRRDPIHRANRLRSGRSSFVSSQALHGAMFGYARMLIGAVVATTIRCASAI